MQKVQKNCRKGKTLACLTPRYNFHLGAIQCAECSEQPQEVFLLRNRITLKQAFLRPSLLAMPISQFSTCSMGDPWIVVLCNYKSHFSESNSWLFPEQASQQPPNQKANVQVAKTIIHNRLKSHHRSICFCGNSKHGLSTSKLIISTTHLLDKNYA